MVDSWFLESECFYSESSEHISIKFGILMGEDGHLLPRFKNT